MQWKLYIIIIWEAEMQKMRKSAGRKSVVAVKINIPTSWLIIS